MARVIAPSRKIFFWMSFVALGATLGVTFMTSPAAAWKNVPQKRQTQKIPYRPQWVTVLKKGELLRYKRKESSSPRIYKDLIFIGSDGGYFYALKKKSGHKVWRFRASGSVNSAAAFRDDAEGGRVFFAGDEGILYALSIATGKPLWKADLGSEVLTAPVVSGDRLFVATAEGRIASIGAEDGRILWNNERSPEGFRMTIRGNSPPVLDEAGDRIFVGFSDGTLWCLSASNGKLAWEKSFAKKTGRGFDDIDGAPLVDGDRLYVASFDGGLFALSRKNGQILWSQPTGSGVGMTTRGDALYVSGSDGKLYAYNKKDGSKIWEKKVGSGALTAPLLYQNLLAVGLSDETMNFLDAGDGHVIARRFARKGVYSDPIIDGDRIYYLSNGGRVYSLRMIR